MVPRSIQHKTLKKVDCGEKAPPQPIRLDAEHPELSIIYTYSVYFKPSGAERGDEDLGGNKCLILDPLLFFLRLILPSEII